MADALARGVPVKDLRGPFAAGAAQVPRPGRGALRRPAFLAGIAAVLAAPRPAAACAMCVAAAVDKASGSLLAGSLLLSILPLAMLGGMILWIRRRVRQIDAAEAARREQPAASLSRASSSR
jgi:hypothetical protein